jgi:pantoate--beta-alanine ligase
MSSRNAYLNSAERKAALCLSRALRKADTMVKEGETNSAIILDTVRREIAVEPLAQLEYASLADAESLLEMERVCDAALLALAVRIGKTRLIDNIILKR